MVDATGASVGAWSTGGSRARSTYELAQAIRGNVVVTEVFLTLSEVIGHADLLVNEGPAREVDDGDVIRYEAIK